MSSEVFGHSIYRGTPTSSVREERERERERERESVCGGSFRSRSFWSLFRLQPSQNNTRLKLCKQLHWNVFVFSYVFLFFFLFFFALFNPLPDVIACAFLALNFLLTFCFPGVLRIRVFMLSSFFLMFSPRGKMKWNKIFSHSSFVVCFLFPMALSFQRHLLLHEDAMWVTDRLLQR